LRHKPSPVGFVHELIHIFGESAEITPEAFFEYGHRSATGYAGVAAARQVQDGVSRQNAAGEPGGALISGHSGEEKPALGSAQTRRRRAWPYVRPPHLPESDRLGMLAMCSAAGCARISCIRALR
jgi:hypothetical protein